MEVPVQDRVEINSNGNTKANRRARLRNAEVLDGAAAATLSGRGRGTGPESGCRPSNMPLAEQAMSGRQGGGLRARRPPPGAGG